MLHCIKILKNIFSGNGLEKACHISQEESEIQNSWESFKTIMESRLSVGNKELIKIEDFDLNPLSTALHGEVSAQRLLLQLLYAERSRDVQAWTVDTREKFIMGNTSFLLSSYTQKK